MVVTPEEGRRKQLEGFQGCGNAVLSDGTGSEEGSAQPSLNCFVPFSG